MSSWKTIKLELAPTSDFPDGSPSRGYVLRLPLDEHGMIDETAWRAHPLLAGVRRSWPNEADMSGHIIAAGDGWVFTLYSGQADGETIFRLQTRPIRTGESLAVTGPDGCSLPFRVVTLRALTPQPGGAAGPNYSI